jgi:hypothetical protein
VINAGKQAQGMSQAAISGDATIYLSITSEEELYARTIRTVHTIVVNQFSVTSIYSLLEMQWANGCIVSGDHAAITAPIAGESVGVGAWLEAGVRVFKVHGRERVRNPLMLTLFPRGVPFGALGDGSTDNATLEQEAVVTRFIGGDGWPFNSFHDLAELDLADSYDGRSPDAKCIASCYAKSFDQLNAHEGFLFMSDWKAALVGLSFDGASVMLGAKNGAAKKLVDMTMPADPMHVVTVHGVAHVEQLANAEAFGDCEYYDEWRGDMQGVYVIYAGSGKRSFGLSTVAHELDCKLLKMVTRHGIRWAASEARGINAFLVDLPSVVTDLEVTVKSELGFEFNLLTPSENFKGKSFWQAFEGVNGRTTRWKAKVVSFEEGASSAMDKFTLRYSNGEELVMGKGELVSKLTDEESIALKQVSYWVFRTRSLLTSDF